MGAPAVGGLLAAAFDEPVTRWLVPDPAGRRPVMTGFFTLLTTDALTGGGRVDVLTALNGELVAAAIWFDHPTTTAASADHPDPRRDAVFGPHLHRWRILEDLRNRHRLPGPHHHLFALGVRSDYQGLGLGARLLAHGHQRLHERPAYVEATSPGSRRLYQRHGYHEIGRIRLPDGPALWRMTACS